VLALIALAADPSPGAATLDALEDVYFPWVGALHSLLDSVVDRDEDAAGGQLNLAGCYGSPAEAATRLRLLAAAARARASALPGADKHELLVAAMVCHYLVELEHSALTAGVYEALGGLARPARTLVRAHGVLRRFSTGRAGGAPGGRSAPAVTPACEFEVVRVRALEQRSDARAA